MKNFMILNIINFTDMARKENDIVLWEFHHHKTHLAQLPSSQSRNCVQETPTETDLMQFESFCAGMAGWATFLGNYFHGSLD